MVVALSVSEQAISFVPSATKQSPGYTAEEALKASLAYFAGDSLAADAFVEKYPLRTPTGRLLEKTPLELHRRLARSFARIEARYPNPMSEEEIFGLFDRFAYLIPQGSPMAAVGNDFVLQSASNCFVIASPYDSYAGILLTDQEQAQIMKRRGGVGFDISPIRPKGIPTSNAARTTDGLGVFMERYSRTCREVAQGGRRGALLMSIDVRHPEIETFINIKRDKKKVTGANISIRFNDEFMQAVKDDSDFCLRWPVDSPNPEIRKVVRARSIWEQFIDAAWDNAEPGALFWDTVKRETPADCYTDVGYGSISTNPCGEIVLSAYDSCRLMLMNTVSYVRDPYQPEARFDHRMFAEHAMKAQRLMDDLVDLEIELVDRILAKVQADPEPASVKETELELWRKIRRAAANGRRTGLGLTSLGDALAALNVRYGSSESIATTEEIYRSFACAVEMSSCILARERGQFTVFSHEKERDNPYLNRVWEADPRVREAWERDGRRNLCSTTTPPAGSMSLFARAAMVQSVRLTTVRPEKDSYYGGILHGVTSGLEPVYTLKQLRRRKVGEDAAHVDFVDDLGDRWQEYEFTHPGLVRWMEATGSRDITASPYYGATAQEIDWIASVDLQAVAQRWISHSISKTCNLPSHATRELVSEVYTRAWEQGCKGFTIYRDGCRTGVILDAEAADKRPGKFKTHHAPKRPVELPCAIHKIKTVEGQLTQNWVILVGLMDNLPYEIFGGLADDFGLLNGCLTGHLIKNPGPNSIYDLRTAAGVTIRDVITTFDNPTQGAFTRAVSLALRHGAPIQYVVEQLQKDKYSTIHSFSVALARVLKGYIPDGTKASSQKLCLQCGSSKMIYQEGCVRCSACSWSKC